ncbi:alcohol dehydrogenase class IV [Roseibium hamelinense]|uniref:Alcohol dehydrogenase 2 n=1 Tax=Roseibium hamelinense TaxID=150831 RepID=A0A562TIV8_9HYPH|nr:iron-containing alcohol dehydrogenase [Roseibium hamelinense]MTI42375.1 iron-containing alcohol dehydrogenase [Roseibium hamelinense]TWI92580.1 alcohol dehydrogenase class IV [Roseibium hamelinense]
MINAFSFNTSNRIVFENGSACALADHAGHLLGERPFVVTDEGIVAAGLIDQPLGFVTESGRQIAVFDRVTADPAVSVIMAACDAAKAHAPSSIIGFGGGSSLDVAKLVALLCKSHERLDDIWGIGNVAGDRLPLVLVPTTAGTGSEVTPISIVTVGADEKRGVVSPVLLPDLALLDPSLTFGLPAHVTAATGVDAMVHAIEAYSSRSANNNPVSRALAVEALKLLGGSIETAVYTPTDLDARGAMLLGSMLAGMAFANSPVAAVHALAYPIGGTFHVPHGLSNALVLPHVLKFNAPAAHQPYSDMAPHVFPELAETVDTEQRAIAFAEHLQDLTRKLGLRTRLTDVGITASDLPKMARDAMKQTRLLVNNPRNLSEADALAIYQAAL